MPGINRRFEIPAIFFFLAFLIFAFFFRQPEFPDAVKIFGLPSHYVIIGGLSAAAFAAAFAAAPRLSPFDLHLAMLAAAFAMSAVFGAGSAGTSSKILAGFILKGLLPASTAARMTAFADYRKISRAVMLCAAAAAFLSLPMLLGYWEIASIRIGFSPIDNPLPAAAVALMFLPLAVGETLLKRSRAGYISAPILAMAVFFSFSRSGWTGAAVGMGIFIWAARDIPSAVKKKITFAAAGALAAALILILAVFPHKMPAGKFRPSAVAQSGSLTHRLGAYSTAAKVFAAKPLFGLGFGNYTRYHKDFLSSGMDLFTDTPDNMYLRILADTGALGFAAFVIFTALWLSRLWKTGADATALAAFCGLAGFLVNQLSADLMLWQAPQAGYWTLFGLGAGIIGTRSKNG